MIRCAALSLLLWSVSCARQPTCPPWAPSSAERATSDGAATPAAIKDDGTVRLAGPDAEDPWLSVVGAGATPAAQPTAAAPDPPAEAPPPPRAHTAVAGLAEARAFFNGRCIPCHGENGRGDGPAGKALKPPPRNFTDKTWQAKVTDAHIEDVILHGGASVGLSPVMPPHADLEHKRDLLKAMRKLIRKFGK